MDGDLHRDWAYNGMGPPLPISCGGIEIYRFISLSDQLTATLAHLITKWTNFLANDRLEGAMSSYFLQ